MYKIIYLLKISYAVIKKATNAVVNELVILCLLEKILFFISMSFVYEMPYSNIVAKGKITRTWSIPKES